MTSWPSPEGTPETISDWKAVAQSLLTQEACAFHRNVEISTQYAWIYTRLPACLKWAGMAAIASHHVRLALFPLRLDSDRTGYVDIPRSLGRHKALLIRDVNTIRETNNAIFDDILWVHLAYLSEEDGVERVRALLGGQAGYATVLSGFEAIDRGRRVLDDESSSVEARLAAEQLIWEGNVQLLEHEQRALVQPHFTNYDDRWSWIVGSVVPKFRRLDADMRLVDVSLPRIFADGRTYSLLPCVVPRDAMSDPASVVAGLCCPNARTYGHLAASVPP